MPHLHAVEDSPCGFTVAQHQLVAFKFEWSSRILTKELDRKRDLHVVFQHSDNGPAQALGFTNSEVTDVAHVSPFQTRLLCIDLNVEEPIVVVADDSAGILSKSVRPRIFDAFPVGVVQQAPNTNQPLSRLILCPHGVKGSQGTP